MRVAIVATAIAGLVCEGFAATTVEMEIDVRGTVRTVVIELDETAAPKTCANFEKLCSQGFYNGIAFHRVIPNYIVQVGDPLSRDPSQKAQWGQGGPGYTIPAELGEPHLRGSVAMARIPGPTNPTKESNGSQFYFALRDIPSLDGDYTVFGKVLSGLEGIEEIADLPKDANFNPIDRIEILSTKVQPANGDTPPAPEPVLAPATTSILPPMPDLDAARRAREAEKAIPPPVIPPASAVAAVDPGAVPAPVETPPPAVDRGLPPMPKLFTETSEDMTPPPAPETPVGAGGQPVPKPVEMPPAPTTDRGLPPMPKLFTEDTTATPPPLPAPLSSAPEPEPVAIPKPVDMPRIKKIDQPSPAAAGNFNAAAAEEGAITIAEIGTHTPKKVEAPARPAPKPEPAPSRPSRSQPAAAPAPAPIPAPAQAPAAAGLDPNAPPAAQSPEDTEEPPKRGFLRGLIHRIW